MEKERELLSVCDGKGGVYFLKHVKDNVIKFGCSKNITKRLKSHKKSFGSKNIFLDMVVLTDKYAYFEDIVKQYSNDVFIDLKNHRHTEIIRYEMEEDLEILYEKLKEIETSVSIQNTDNRELEVEMMRLRVRELELLNTRKKVEKKKEDKTDTPLYKFLVEHSVYDSSNSMNGYEIKGLLEDYTGKKIRKLEYDTFIRVDDRYTITYNKKICKHCKKEAERGCCENYKQKDRISTRVINNIRITYPTNK